MSLVAYAASSDDEGESDNEKGSSPINEIASSDIYNNDAEDTVARKNGMQMKTLFLPIPKLENKYENSLPLFGRLPEPKASTETKLELIEEDDDEFLHKKAVSLETPKKNEQPLKKRIITIPSLKDFDDVKEKKPKNFEINVKTSTFSSLMSILPLPKSEQSLLKVKSVNMVSKTKQLTEKNNLIPDTVKNHRPAQNTENVDKKLFKKCSPQSKQKATLIEVSDSEGSDDADFFSLQTDYILPEISEDEIAKMVSKKAAEMAKASSTFDLVSKKDILENEVTELGFTAVVSNSKTQLNKEEIQALIGSQAKRCKMDELQVIDISSDQVLPNKDEWLRTALASSTTYQTTGVLTDEEPAAGTRRKHQITYLAHKAKANEAELQAMWSANRQNRRQTQSKYGF